MCYAIGYSHQKTKDIKVKGDKETGRPMTEKRQKILDKAFAQLRKARAEMDPKILSSIRRMIAGSPEMMKKLGIDEKLEPKVEKPAKKEVAKEVLKAPKKESKPVQSKPKNVEGYEKIDQGKNMEVMAKLMALNPDGKDKIKSAIKKASE